MTNGVGSLSTVIILLTRFAFVSHLLPYLLLVQVNGSFNRRSGISPVRPYKKNFAIRSTLNSLNALSNLLNTNKQSMRNKILLMMSVVGLLCSCDLKKKELAQRT